MFWKRIQKSKVDGCVEKVMFDYVVINGVKHSTDIPLVFEGQVVSKGQPIGKTRKP